MKGCATQPWEVLFALTSFNENYLVHQVMDFPAAEKSNAFTQAACAIVEGDCIQNDKIQLFHLQ